MTKISIKVDKDVLANTNTPSVHAAYRAALLLLAELVNYGTSPRFHRLYRANIESPWDCRKDFNKFICGCHAESNYVAEVFEEAERIEFRLSTYPEMSLKLYLNGYWKGSENAFYSFEFWFDREGKPAGGGYSHLNKD